MPVIYNFVRKLARFSTGVVLVGGTLWMGVGLSHGISALGRTTSRPVVGTATQPAVILRADPPVVAVVPTPAPAPPAPAPAPVVKRVARPTAAAHPAPVVAPAPGSSVDSLTPTTPTGNTSGPATTTGYTSTNWSGYLMTGQSFTAVSGSWTATTPTGLAGITSADATWIGIGGVSAGDLIQVGTDNIVSASGQVQTTAFYELLPAASQPIDIMTVAPGDAMAATIVQTAPGQWSIAITDTTTGQSFTKAVAYGSSLSSAEWIEEDPSYSHGRQIPFDVFGLAAFSGAHATGNGSDLNLSGGNAQPITMVNRSGQIIAAPTALGSGATSFQVNP